MEQRLPKIFYAGVFLLSVCMLASQLLLTRLLSILFWYHFVFMIVSIVMFGLTVGTLIVYFFPKHFSIENTARQITWYSILSALAIFGALLSIFYLPGVLAGCNISLQGIVKCYFPVLLIPFVFLGIVFALILTRFPSQIGKIYGVNLIGSAFGCLAAYWVLDNFNGASAIFIFSALCLLAAVCFSLADPASKKGSKYLTVTLIIALGWMGMINQEKDFIQFMWYKDHFKSVCFYSKWNFFSRVTVHPVAFIPFGWGFSEKVKDEHVKVKEWMILIDGGAGTVMTKFEDVKDLTYLNMDVSSTAYHLRKARSALIIGSGGGRDLLTAVINGVQKVVGVEINKGIIEVAYDFIKEPQGTVRQFPQIEIHNDDGRSFVARSPERYDVIQASLVDTFAAASSGAYALSENSLYTKEAWVTYLKHLTPEGILTFSRWHHATPLEIYRVLTLAKSALREVGVTDYRQHILLVIAPKLVNGGFFDVGTILVSLSPFTDQEIAKLKSISKDLLFKVALTKDESIDPVFDRIFEQSGDVYDFPLIRGNIDPPTDNRPFFFYFSDFKHFFEDLDGSIGPKTLRDVTLLIVIFGAVFILIPCLVTAQSKGLDHIRFLPTVYFSSIGFAFMFVEIPLIQRLGVFLGHPIYGLTVVLFTLLFFCGLGSNYSKKVQTRKHAQGLFMLLFIGLMLIAFLLPAVIQWATAVPVFLKIIIALLSLCSVGFLMGIPFPLGVANVSAGPRTPLIFYWAVNGFTSMCGSAFAMVILIHMGYPWAVMFGLFFYLAAFAAMQKFIKL